MTTSIVQGFINSIPDKRIARAFSEIFYRITPSKLDTAITANAAGTKADAQALKSTCSFHDVTTVAGAGDSILLPPAKEGEFHFVKNSAAANAMQVFGQGTDTIDSVATGTGVSQLAGDGVLYYCLVPGNWLRLGGVAATEVFGAITATSISVSGGFAIHGAAIVTTQAAALTTQTISALTTQSLAALTTQTLSTLTSVDLSVLDSTPVVFLSTVQIAALSTSIAALTSEVEILKTNANKVVGAVPTLNTNNTTLAGVVPILNTNNTSIASILSGKGFTA